MKESVETMWFIAHGFDNALPDFSLYGGYIRTVPSSRLLRLFHNVVSTW